MTDKQIIIDGVDITELDSDKIPFMNKYEVARLFMGTIRLLQSKNEECERLYEERNVLNTANGALNNLVEKLEKEKEDWCFDCDVAERMRKVTYAATGGRLSYANYTVEAIEQAYNDQLRIDVEYRTKELEEQLDSVVREWEEYTEKYKQVLREIKNLTESQEYVGFWEDCLSEIGRKASEVLDE